MLIRKPDDVRPSEITSESTYLNRRAFARTLAAGAALSAVPGRSNVLEEELTPEHIVTSYNNFYEFGTDKDDPAAYAHEMTTEPWKVRVTGEAGKTGEYDLEDILRGIDVEERIYRFRCVEAWSMVVPWSGVPLAKVLSRFEPTGQAKYVAFETLNRPSEMRGQRSYFSSIDWPYVEGLRMDEAMHPLTLMVTGVYGKPLPNQNGAPWRLMVPWKYGFKSGKSIVRIHFTSRQPKTSWNKLAPQEYGFYANVNPEVDHPRWSQAEERRLPASFFSPKIPTLMFNGYGDQVASLYDGMNLKRHY